MKLVIDMSALSVDKRKMVMDYLFDNGVSYAWHDAPVNWVLPNPQLDIYAEVAKEVNSLPTAPLKNWGTRERFVGKHPALAAPYISSIPPGVFDDLIEGVCRGAEQAGIPRRLLGFEHGTKEPKPNPFLVQRALRAYGEGKREWLIAKALREARGLELMTEDDFRAQYMCEFKPDPKAWIPHYGGPCPVNHDEVEVELRGDHRVGKDVETRSVKRRGMPESFIWQWGRPTDPTSRNDVLNWRLALPKENTQEWADAEARRQQGLEPKPTTSARYSMTQIDELLKSEWVEKSGGLVWAYCPRNGVDRCTLAISRITGSGHVWLEKEYQGPEARDQAHKFLQGLEPKRYPFRNEVAQLCFGTRTKHRWAPTRPLLSYKSPNGKEAPILECVHCGVRIYGPYEELPLHLRNEDDPSVNMHHQD